MILIILISIIFIALIIISSFRPISSQYSQFEIEHRLKIGIKSAKREHRRQNSLNDLLALKQLITSILLVIISVLSVIEFAWLNALIIAVFASLSYGFLTNITIIQSSSQKLYLKIEEKLLSFIEKYKKIFIFIKSSQLVAYEKIIPGSRDEFIHIIQNSGSILTNNEKQLIKHNLSFSTQLVGSIMTNRSDIISVDKSELLGPLALDELHKTGHSRFPVIKKDIDHVLGLLYIRDLFNLNNKKSSTAENMMESKVYYIKNTQTLAHALAALVNTQSHMLIVVEKDFTTVGLLTLNDVIEAMIGHRIIDDFDTHDHLATVASR